MSNSNGMYNVLNIFKKLQPTQEQSVKAEAQAIYESVEAKGSILEGVKSVEDRLNEKYMGFKKVAAAAKAGGAEDPEAVAASIGRKKYGKKAFQKAAAAGTKMDEEQVDQNNDGKNDFEDVKVARMKAALKGKNKDTNEQMDEMFAFDTKPGKDRGPRDTGRGDELARREKVMGKGGLGKGKPFGNEYKSKGKYGNQYDVAGPKGVLPEDQLDEIIDIDTLNQMASHPMAGAMAAAGGAAIGGAIGGAVKKAGDWYKNRQEKKAMSGNSQRGMAEGERESNPRIPGTDKTAQSRYNPTNKPAPVKKLAKPTDKFDKIKNESRIRQIAEGINFAEMMKETDSGIAEMLSEIQADINSFKKTGHCSDKLEAFLKVHNHGKRLMGETVPKGPSFAPQDAMALAKPTAPFEPSRIQGTKPSILDRAKGAVGSMAGGINKALGHGSDDELLSDLHNKSTFEDVELNELARLAGLNVSESINLGELATDMESHEGKITVNTNSSSDGTKSVNISADGAAADQLMQMLKLAGMESNKVDQETDSFGSCNTCGDDEGAIAIDVGGEEEMDEATAEYANVPAEEYQGVDTIIHQGDDMNREKKQFKKEYPGDNPMAVQTLEDADPRASFGRDLMAEYQALKLRK